MLGAGTKCSLAEKRGVVTAVRRPVSTTSTRVSQRARCRQGRVEFPVPPAQTARPSRGPSPSSPRRRPSPTRSEPRGWPPTRPPRGPRSRRLPDKGGATGREDPAARGARLEEPSTGRCGARGRRGPESSRRPCEHAFRSERHGSRGSTAPRMSGGADVATVAGLLRSRRRLSPMEDPMTQLTHSRYAAASTHQQRQLARIAGAAVLPDRFAGGAER
jgi:hypothetical protein